MPTLRPVRQQPPWLNRAIGAIAQGKSKAEAARIAGVSPRMLFHVLATLPDWSGVRPERIKA